MTKLLPKNFTEIEKQKWMLETLRYLGYRQATEFQLDEETRTLLESTLMELEDLRVPPPAWGIFDIEVSVEEHKITLGERPEVIKSTSLSHHLAGYTTVALMAVTLGQTFDTTLKRLMLTEPSKAMVYDAAGSALVEIHADRLEHSILFEAGINAKDSVFRYSPGYGDLELFYNKLFVDLLRADKSCGITVTPGFAMTPKKSITAILGLRSSSTHSSSKSIGGCRPDGRCELCPLNKNCLYKRR